MMKGGFLGSSRASSAARTKATKAQKDREQPPAQGRDQEQTNPSNTGQPQHKTQEVLLSPEQWASNFEQCLQLLAGPGDETRFVGLLLATKLLPQGGNDALRRVLNAVGWPFVQRLLHPLTTTHQAPLTAEQLDQQQLCVRLGLSMLSALCRLPEVAHGTELQQMLPSLVVVLSKCGHLEGTVADQSSVHTVAAGVPGQPEGWPLDWAVLGDALECLLAATNQQDQLHMSQQGNVAMQHLQQGQGLEVLAKVLSRAVEQGRGCDWQGGRLGVANVWHLPVLATRLVRTLLASTTLTNIETAMETDKNTDIQPSVYVLLLPVLCHLLGLPQVLECRGASVAAQVKRTQQLQQEHEARQKQQQQQQQQQMQQQEQQEEQQQQERQVQQQSQQLQGSGQEQDDEHQENQLAHTELQPPSLPPAPEEDAALLQLEALHALQLLLTRHHPTLLSTPHTDPAYTLSGTLMSTSEAGDTARKSAASGVAAGTSGDVAGWGAAARRGLGWVLRGRRLGEPQRHAALQIAAGLVEVLGPSWLFTPPVAVTRASGVQTQQQELIIPLTETLQIELGLLLRDASHRTTPPTTDTTHTTDTAHTTEPTQQTGVAGQRALDRLPAVLSLLEAILEALAEDTETDKDTLDTLDTMSPAPTKQQPLCLAPALQQQVFQSVSASVRLVLDFLQSVSDLTTTTNHIQPPTTLLSPSNVSASVQMAARSKANTMDVDMEDDKVVSLPSTGAPPPEVLLACTRLVGHFLAEVPDALEMSVMHVLHVLLSPSAAGRAGGAGGGMLGLQDLDDMALGFMLPGLLQVVSSPSSKVAQQLTDTLCQPHIISVIGKALGRVTQVSEGTCAAVAASVTADRHATERRLADICMLLVHVLEVRGGVFTSTQLQACRVLWDGCSVVAGWVVAHASPVCGGILGRLGGVDSPANQMVNNMAGAGLQPRTVLCSAAMGALVLQGCAGQVDGCAGGASMEQHLRSVCGLVVLGLEVGWVLGAAVVMEEMSPGSVTGGLAGEGLGDAGARRAVLEDVSGDGEHCWEVLLCAAGVCVHQVPVLRACIRESSVGQAMQQDIRVTVPPSGVDVRKLYEWAKGEVQEQSVGWQLLKTQL